MIKMLFTYYKVYFSQYTFHLVLRLRMHGTLHLHTLHTFIDSMVLGHRNIYFTSPFLNITYSLPYQLDHKQCILTMCSRFG